MQLRRLAKSTGRRAPRALAVMVTAVIAAIAIGGAIPASAEDRTAETVDPGEPNGTATFYEYGDDINLCDHRADGHGVGVFVDYVNENGNRKKEWYWHGGGAGTCRAVDLEVAEDTNVWFYACLADHTKKGGKKPDAIESTCSTYWTIVYNNNW